MPITDSDMRIAYQDRYGFALDSNDVLTVYRTSTADQSKHHRRYITTPDNIIWSTKVTPSTYEVVFVGDHTLVDSDNVYTEYAPIINIEPDSAGE